MIQNRYLVVWESDQGKTWEWTSSEKEMESLLDSLGAYGVDELHVFGPEGELDEFKIEKKEAIFVAILTVFESWVTKPSAGLDLERRCAQKLHKRVQIANYANPTLKFYDCTKEEISALMDSLGYEYNYGYSYEKAWEDIERRS